MTERRVRQLPNSSRKTNKVKSQKNKQDRLLNAVLLSGLVSCASTPLCDQFGLLRRHICMTKPIQTLQRHIPTELMWCGKESHVGRSGL
jgi:hypothetical protein